MCALCVRCVQDDVTGRIPDSLGSVFVPLDHHALATYAPTEQDKLVRHTA